MSRISWGFGISVFILLAVMTLCHEITHMEIFRTNGCASELGADWKSVYVKTTDAECYRNALLANNIADIFYYLALPISLLVLTMSWIIVGVIIE